MEAFSTLVVLKWELKSVYAADFAKQASRIQEFTEIIQELELNQALAEVTKLLHLTFAFLYLSHLLLVRYHLLH